MKMENTYDVDKSTYKNLKIIEKLEIYPEIPTCSKCKDDLCTIKEYKYFLKYKPFSHRYLFVPLFFKNFMFFREICNKCLDKKFGKRKYNTLTDCTKFALQMTDLECTQITKEKYCTASKSSFIKRHGEINGLEMFEQYRQRQSYTNSQEYKEMSDEEFTSYNKSRAVTLINMTLKHGEEEGTRRFEQYRERQSYTNSKEYFLEKYGEVDGLSKYNSFLDTRSFRVSKMSIHFFDKIQEEFPNLTMLYNENEMTILNKTTNRYNSIDFTIPSLKYCIEFKGDVFHGNPNIFSESDTPNPFDKTATAKELWTNDYIREMNLENEGYIVRSVWEYEYNNNFNEIFDIIINDIKERTC